MSGNHDADHVEILRTLVKQNDAMERMIASFDDLSKRLDRLANLDERCTSMEARMREDELATIAFRTKVETLSKLGWWALATAAASIMGHLIRGIPF